MRAESDTALSLTATARFDLKLPREALAVLARCNTGD